MEDKTGGPAFPTDSAHQSGHNTWHYEGMTLRDYFAAKADLSNTKIQNIADAERILGVSRPSDRIEAFEWECKLIAKIRYMMADAMLEARK